MKEINLDTLSGRNEREENILFSEGDEHISVQ